jgi:hypothetical protein
MATDPTDTLRLAHAELVDELGDVRKEFATLAVNLQTLPAVGAVTLALFAALATLPTYQKPVASMLLVLGLVPFVILTAISIRELGRKPEGTEPLQLSQDEDRISLESWLVAHIGERRTEIRTLRGAIVLKRNRLALCSALLAGQVSYLVVVTMLFATLSQQK